MNESYYNDTYISPPLLHNKINKSSKFIQKEKQISLFTIPIKENKNKSNHQDIMEKISERFTFLDESLEDDQDREIYENSKLLFLQVMEIVRFPIEPLIGVDDSGQVVAEWHKVAQIKFAILICVNEEKILFQTILKNGSSKNIKSNLKNINDDLKNELEIFYEISE